MELLQREGAWGQREWEGGREGWSWKGTWHGGGLSFAGEEGAGD